MFERRRRENAADERPLSGCFGVEQQYNRVLGVASGDQRDIGVGHDAIQNGLEALPSL